MKNLFIASLFIILSSCAANSTSTPPSAENETESTTTTTSSSTTVNNEEVVSPTLKDRVNNCTCVKMWMPVCGENKKTYGNSCEADCAGVKYTSGACKEKAKKM